MKDFLDHFAAVVGAATLALLLFAVCHEYGYFWVIGSHFQTFASTSDYFTNATQWILFAALLLYTWMDWKAVLGVRSYTAPLGKDWRTWLFPAIILFPFLLVAFFTPYNLLVSFFFVFSYVWLVYGVKKVPFVDTEDPNYRRFRSAVIAMPVLAVAAFVAGQFRASGALDAMDNPYKLRMKGGDERNRILLRSFDKGLLVRSPTDERVEFIKWDQIEEVTKPSPRSRGESYSCLWFEINCSKKPIIP